MSTQSQIIEHLEDQIAARRLREGEQLPTEKQLAARFNTTLSTAHRALKALEGRGIVTANKRAGTALAPDAANIVQTARNSRKSLVRVLLPLEARQSAYWVDAALSAFETAARDAGCRVVYATIPADASAWREFVDARREETAGALVLLSPTGQERGPLMRHQDVILEYPGEIYSISRGDVPFREYPWHTIVFDPYREGYVAGRFLARRGYPRLLFLESENSWAKARFAGAREALENNGAPSLEIQTLEAGGGVDPFAGALSFIRSCPDKVCVLARNDHNAARFLDFAAGLGLLPRRDFDLVAFSDDPAFRHYNLTTVTAALDKCGEILADAVLRNPFSLRTGSRLIIRPEPVLIERETC